MTPDGAASTRSLATAAAAPGAVTTETPVKSAGRWTTVVVMAGRSPTTIERLVPLAFLGLCAVALVWIGVLLGFAVPVIVVLVIAVGASICL